MTSAPNKYLRDSGISLLEVMVALAIIAMVAALVAPRVMGSFGRAIALFEKPATLFAAFRLCLKREKRDGIFV
ncbi:MAG: prepilin-type N-terminal cleavage/methylation domain-containing protein [Hyphomicrobiales bacterium]